MRVLSWNLYHGRDFPPDKALFTLRSRLLRITERNETHAQVNRSLCREFTGWVGDCEWDVALLQEAPPLWFRAFRRRTAAVGARVFTSRNVVPPLQRFAAFVNPDLIASWEGGSNQILVREPGRILEERRMILTEEPERRTMVWARAQLPDGAMVSFANLHASAGQPERASLELPAAAAAAVEWSGGGPLVFGGDMNLRPRQHPRVFEELRERFGLGEPTGPMVIDHLLARGLEVVEPARQLAPEERELPERDGRRLRLSDHAPVVAQWEVGSPTASR
jgi:hypothetical protein